ncbi:xanthine dehydrogenase family protein molybdopterin-binding subunit [Advenella mimigardefordensis]|uniref:Putative carbon monoxide dehydrogenase large chain n=1 Tax=Advenella mimigardefordensis (strain DSM 17166 / LMG 22922 / DPN7) TaxID=1247726 RepID=W0PEU3_ADVMD|nr:molybdopterin cofactor-binding domain-containing protein [Advenella mimigardefordensis]AHG65504.1 putative carbon monoxide dehydrogenase large chain [Advenella mimigardefordensis DPN7]
MSSVENAATGGTGKFVGQRIERFESIPLLAGRGRYGDDLGVKPGTLHAAVYRSSYAHARIKSIDVSQAEKMPGVRAVLTPDDVRAWSRPFINGVKMPMQMWATAMDKVRYVGEPIAVVIAEDRYLAEDAFDGIKVEFEALPPVSSIEGAMSGQSAILHEEVGTNVLHEREFNYGDPQARFQECAHSLEMTVEYPRNSCTPIECGVVIAEYLPGDDGYEVCSNFMGPFSMHAVMSLALNVPGNRLRHRSAPDSGGSFGVKQAVFTSVVLMCLASRKAGGAPVKWVEDRLEHLSAATAANGRVATIKAAFDSDGRIRALDLDQIDDVGAYLRAPEPATFYRMHGILTGAYRIDDLHVCNRVVVTNKMPSGLVRGFGGPQVYFALERMMQRIAQHLDMDPLDVYRRNFIQPEAFPYKAAAGALLDSGDYPKAMAAAIDEGGLEELLRRRDEARARGRLYGIGYAAIVEPSISNMGYITIALTPEQRAKAGPKNGGIAAATINIDLLGSVTVVIASSPAGQGHVTVCAQVVADVFGLQPKDINVNVDFDTDKDAWSVAAGNYSSRFAGAVAGTVHLAATRLRGKLADIAAHQFKCLSEEIVFEGGKVWREGHQDKAVPFARLASSAHWAPAELPDGMSPGMRVTEFWTPESLGAPTEDDRINTSAAYGFAFDICAVELDRKTGSVRIDRYVTAHDAGKILNPAMADGQIRGAFAQGLGAALLEEFRYGDDGGFQSGTFADYLLPTSYEVPDPVIVHLETPSPFTPLGAKGLGEGNNMSTPVCIANAVADALSPLGGTPEIRLPLTPNRVLALIGFDDPAPSSDVQIQKPAKKTGKGHALTASGSTQIPATPEKVFDVLMDPQALAQVIPGCRELQQIGQNQYRADVTISIGMIKARYEATISLSNIDRPNSLHLQGTGVSSLGGATGGGDIVLQANEQGTLMKYQYEAEVQGKVAAVGGRMLEGAARMVLGQLFEQLGKQASGQGVVGGSDSVWRRILRFLRISK